MVCGCSLLEDDVGGHLPRGDAHLGVLEDQRAVQKM